MRSTSASSAAIVLKARASSPTSSREVAVTRRWSSRPVPSRGRRPTISRSGERHPVREHLDDRERDRPPPRSRVSSGERPSALAEPDDADGDEHRGDDHDAELELDRVEGVERSHRQRVRVERVADAVHRPDHGGVELAPDRADVRVDRALAGAVLVAPDLLEQAAAAVDDVRREREAVEEVELGRREVDARVGVEHLARGGIDHERADAGSRARPSLGRSRGRRGAAARARARRARAG